MPHPCWGSGIGGRACLWPPSRPCPAAVRARRREHHGPGGDRSQSRAAGAIGRFSSKPPNGRTSHRRCASYMPERLTAQERGPPQSERETASTQRNRQIALPDSERKAAPESVVQPRTIPRSLRLERGMHPMFGGHLVNGNARTRTNRALCWMLCSFSLACLAAAATAQRTHADQGPVTRLTTDGKAFAPRGLGWSPTGEYIGCYRWESGGSQLMVRSADGEVQVPVSRVGAPSTAAWSPDGKHIAYVYAENDDDDSEARVYVWSLETRQSAELARGFRNHQFGYGTGYGIPVWSPDSRYFVCKVRRVSLRLQLPARGGRKVDARYLAPAARWLGQSPHHPRHQRYP